MNLITNNLNGFQVTLERAIGPEVFKLGNKPLPDCRFAVRITPGRMKFKSGRNLEDVFFLMDYPSALAQYNEFERYAKRERA